MLDSFFSGVGEELARHWVARVLTPAFAFWTAGLGLLWWGRHADGVRAQGWVSELAASSTSVAELPVVVQGAIVVGSVVLLAASAGVAERLTLPLLRLLEGYWTRPEWLRRMLVSRRQRRYDVVKERFDGLDVLEYRARRAGSPSSLSPQERARYGRDRRLLDEAPSRPDLRMPTRLGELLREAEYRPVARYGIDAIRCWPALWRLLPPDLRSELTAARAALDTAVRGWLWGALFLLWTPVSWWAVPVGLVVPLLAYSFGVLPRARVFGELIVTAYDLHRMALYDAAFVLRPTSPDEERGGGGERLTKALAGLWTGPRARYHFTDRACPDGDTAPTSAADLHSGPADGRAPRRGRELLRRLRVPRG